MRVGVNGRVFSVSEPGGSPVAGINLTKHLAQIDGIEVVVFGHGNLREQFEAASIVSSYLPVNSQVYGIVWEQTVLRRLVRKYDIDVLLCPNNNGVLTECSVPVVTWLHDIFTYKGDVPIAYKILQRFRFPRVLSASDAVATVSEFTKSEIQNEFSVAEEKLSVVPNGVQDIFHSQESTPLALPDKYILFVGNLNTRKNIPVLIESFRILKKDHRLPHKLVIIGPGEKSFYNYPIDEVNQEGIEVLGYVDTLELKYAYKQADVFLFPSLYEGFGMVALEAMACGTPVVAGDRASLPEVLGEGALLVDPEDTTAIATAVERVLSEESLRESLVERGYKQTEKYTWDRAAEKMGAVLEEVVDL